MSENVGVSQKFGIFPLDFFGEIVTFGLLDAFKSESNFLWVIFDFVLRPYKIPGKICHSILL